MPTINLLPWREELNEEKKQAFLILMGLGVFAAGIVMFFLHLFISHEISTQVEDNAYLQAQITQLDARLIEIATLKNEKAKLIARIKIIQELQVSRPRIVEILDSFVQALPDGLFFTLVKRTGSDILIEGRAESSTRVSKIMRNFEAAKLYDVPVLKAIQTDQDTHSSWKDFSLTLHQKESL